MFHPKYSRFRVLFNHNLNFLKLSTIKTMSVFYSFKFDNTAIRRLPVDSEERNFVRTVNGACFSRVTPTPVKKPNLVAISKSALQLLDIEEKDTECRDFVEFFTGNKLMPGSETYSHCYCGHQFGVFAGQLGDGAAIYLGEVINKKGVRWELQLKGAGLTPYSRDADGRKVLRSSIREFLCSEAMHHLGIPTTRAGSCITSDDKVARDIFYDGHPKYENCTVISRIAESFLRFGSFEIFKLMDPESGRRGPSLGRHDILKQLADYSIEMLYPEIDKIDNVTDKYKAFYKEVILRTAKLVALWQCVGFCHGVLNTDNMSIVGLTIDYGPFGFLDRFNPEHICNTSDDNGRYTYVNQPKICYWNLYKFAEALSPLVPLVELKEILEANYQNEFEKVYFDKMRMKFGLSKKLEEDEGDILSDHSIVKTFFETLEQTGSDFTNSFRLLSSVQLPGLPDHTQSLAQVKAKLLEQCSSVQELIESNEGGRQLNFILMLLRENPDVLRQLIPDPRIIERALAKAEKTEKLKDLSEEDKRASDDKLYSEWLAKYSKRLEHDYSQTDAKSLDEQDSSRRATMNANNPRFVLRNHLAQQAITKAEEGDFSEVRKLLKILENPYDQLETDDELGKDSYDKKPPNWACKLKVSCSS